MKILHLLQSKYYSGAENIVIQIIKMMEGNKDVECIYVSSAGPIESVLIEKKINYILIEKLTISNVKKVISNYEPDIIHSHDFQASVICSILKRDELLVSHIHSNPNWLKRLNTKTLLFLASSFRIDKILTVSKHIINDYIFSNLIKNKSINIGNPFDVNSIRKKASVAPLDLEYDIIFVGRLEEVKNPLKFIGILSKIKQYIPNVKAAMVGGGSLYEECQIYIDELSLSSNITLLGFQENPYRYIQGSKMLCITSRNEGYSLVALEAIALSKPVISFDVGEVANIIDESCGVVNNDEEVIISSIISLLEDSQSLMRKSQNAFIKSEKIKNYDEYRKVMLDIYQNTI